MLNTASIIEHILQNKTKLQHIVVDLERKLELEHTDHKLRAVLYTALKKANRKLVALEQHLLAACIKKERQIRKKEHSYKISVWQQHYPHYYAQGCYVVAGKNAKRSDVLKKYVKQAKWYYHITYNTGGSVINFSEHSAEHDQISIQFALVFSSYWNIGKDMPTKVSKASTKNVITTHVKAGLYSISGTITQLVATVKLPIYYDSTTRVLVYTPSDTFIGYLVKNPQHDLKQQIKRIIRQYNGIIDPYILDNWYPSTGVIVNEVYKTV